jgi:hypothetical protein
VVDSIDIAEEILAKQVPEERWSVWLFDRLERSPGNEARLLIIVHDDSASFHNSLDHLPLLSLPLNSSPKPRAWNCANQHEDQQRPQAELKPSAFALGRLSFGRLGWHGRIIRRRGQPEQGIREAGRGRVVALTPRTDSPGDARPYCFAAKGQAAHLRLPLANQFTRHFGQRGPILAAWCLAWRRFVLRAKRISKSDAEAWISSIGFRHDLQAAIFKPTSCPEATILTGFSRAPIIARLGA